MERITIDIDTRNKLKLIWIIAKTFYHIPEFKAITLEQSNSKGYHLVIWLDICSTKKQFSLRKALNDDKHRLFLDIKRKYPKQYLFFKKIRVLKRWK